MAIKVLIQLRTKPGARDEFKRFIEKFVAELGPSMKQRGWMGSTFYEALGDPDLLVEIADWTSAEAHSAVVADPAFGEALAPGVEQLAGPYEVTVLEVP